jgi:hypothetical protein
MKLRTKVRFGGPRRAAGNPFPGTFETPAGGKLRLKVW